MTVKLWSGVLELQSSETSSTRTAPKPKQKPKVEISQETTRAVGVSALGTPAEAPYAALVVARSRDTFTLAPANSRELKLDGQTLSIPEHVAADPKRLAPWLSGQLAAMGFSTDHILPRYAEKVLGGPVVEPEEQRALASADLVVRVFRKG